MTTIVSSQTNTEQVMITSRAQVGFAGGGSSYRDMVVVSGYASDFSPTALAAGAPSGVEQFIVEITVGPLWRKIYDVLPLLTRAGMQHDHPDVADVDGYQHHKREWMMVDEDGGQRIRLRTFLSLVKSEATSPPAGQFAVTFGGNVIPVLAYRLTAICTLMK